MKTALFLFVFLGMLGFSNAHGETVDVSLGQGKITARKATVEHGDYLNICSRDEATHQPYSLGPSNKFGSSKAKEKDILSKGNCRLVTVKNKGPDITEVRIQDRFMPEAALTLRVQPRPQAAKKKDAPKSDDAAATKTADANPDQPVFANPMQGNSCYAPEDGCGRKAADAWCQGKGYKGAQKWEVEPKDQGKARSARYIGSDVTCKARQCDTFSSVTCRTGPPTFF
jgi:hypothetical protein